MDRERCPLCDGEQANVPSHLFAAHKITAAELKKRFPQPIKEDSMSDCPHCAVKDSEIKRLEEKRAEDRAAHDRERETMTRQLQANAQPRYPSIADFVAHCESGTCPNHAAEWQALKMRLVEDAWAKMPTDVLEKRALEAGLVPERIEVRL